MEAVIRYLGEEHGLSVLEINDTLYVVTQWEPANQNQSFNMILGHNLSAFIKSNAISEGAFTKQHQLHLGNFLTDIKPMRKQFSHHHPYILHSAR